MDNNVVVLQPIKLKIIMGQPVKVKVSGKTLINTETQTALNAKANASDTVNLTGNQTVAGVKTFSSSPIVPTATTGTQAINKSQMDTADALKVNKAGDTITGNLIIQTAVDTSFSLTNQTAVTGKSYRVISTNGGNFGVWNTTDSKTPFRVYIDAPDAGLEVVSNGLNIQGVRYLTGTGFPEGSVTAPVGSIYIDKAITNGASSWIKKSGTGNTGWQVLEGDTGERNITPGTLPTGIASSSLRIQRKDGIVFLWMTSSEFTSTSEIIYLAELPSGFKPRQGAVLSDNIGPGTSRSGGVSVSNNTTNGLRVQATVGLYRTFHVTFATSEPWPTTLPGVSA